MSVATVRRLSEAVPYHAPKHYDVRTLRLQGMEASDADAFWVGLSHYLPGGGAEESPAVAETVYVGVAGVTTVHLPQGPVELGPFDSLHLRAGDLRSITNATQLPSSILVVIGTAPPADRA